MYKSKKMALLLLFIFLVVMVIGTPVQAELFNKAADSSKNRIKPVNTNPWSTAPAKEKPFKEGEIIIKLKKNVNKNDLIDITEKINVNLEKNFPGLSSKSNHQYFKVTSSTLSTEKLIDLINQESIIESAAPNFRRYMDSSTNLPDDEFFDQLWGLHNTGQFSGLIDADIDAPEAWAVSTGSPDVVIAHIDTGVDYTHEDLRDNIWINQAEAEGIPGVDDDNNGYVDDICGYDFASDNMGNNDNDPMDIFGHGTHTAGIMAAVGNNHIGITGVSWSAKVLPIKCFGPDGYLYDSDAIEAIEYIVSMKERGVNIVAINAPWGAYSWHSQPLKDAIEIAGSAGIIFCTSAGNESVNCDGYMKHYPAGFDLPNIISVAWTDNNDDLSPYSNYGKRTIDIAAPGENILSTLPGYIPDEEEPIPQGSNAYFAASGTSMAASFVSGAISVVADVYPGDDVFTRVNRILSGADKLSNLEEKVYTGGRLNLANSLDPDIELLPMITSVDPSTGLRAHSEIIINGNNFGSKKGKVYFTNGVNEKQARIVSWSDTAIKAVVHMKAEKYVYVNQKKGSDSKQFPCSLWEMQANSLIGRDNAAAVAYNNKIYLFGGNWYCGTFSTNYCEAYNPDTGIWSLIETMPTSRSLLTAAAAGDSIYVIGGFNDYDVLDTVEVYNPAADSWDIAACLPQPLAFLKAVSLDGKVYVIGGSNIYSQPQNTLYCYDPVTDTWSELAGMNQARFEHGAVAYNGKIYVFGGITNTGEYTNTGEVYDPDTNTWTPIADSPVPIARMGVATDGNMIYSIGGTNGDFWFDYLPVVMRYLPKFDSWIFTPDSLIELITPKSCAPAVFLENYGIYSINGIAGGNSTNEVEVITMMDPKNNSKGKNPTLIYFDEKW